MAETIKAMWLTDDNQNKIAPKTLSSQILNEDGTLFEDEIKTYIDESIEAISTYTLGSFGVTATADELNYMDGVTSNVQTQLDTLSSEKADVNAVHAEYFQITEDGVASLKPEYRGACPSSRQTECPDAISDMGVGVTGSMNAELPNMLEIPESIGGIKVLTLATGIFLYNKAITEVRLPNTITSLPDRFCDNATNVRHVRNTDRITSIGKTAFQTTYLERADFPALTTFGGVSTFQNCGSLKYANIGKVTAIPDKTFNYCKSLERVENEPTLTIIGAGAFFYTFNLKDIDYLPTNISNINESAFGNSAMVYNWDSLTNCTFGTRATSKQTDPNGYWMSCKFTPCKNPIPTQLHQKNPLWANVNIGNGTLTKIEATLPYSSGCSMMAIMHAYSGVTGKKFFNPLEFEALIGQDVIRANFSWYASQYDLMFSALGLTATDIGYIDSVDKAQTVYDALRDGKYVIATVASSYTDDDGHVVVVYGVDEDGNLLILDSDGTNVSRYLSGIKGCSHPSNIYWNGSDGHIWIVS